MPPYHYRNLMGRQSSEILFSLRESAYHDCKHGCFTERIRQGVTKAVEDGFSQ